YASGASGLAAARLAENMRSFLHQSFLPVVRPDEVPVGFAPYFLYVVLIVAAVVALMALVRRRGLPRPRGSLGRALIGACFSLGLIGFGYLPAFISRVLKSQRGFFGDLFLLIVLVFWLLRLLENGWI